MEEESLSIKKKPSILTNYIYNVIYEIVIIVVPFITASYTSRIFQADGIGIYSFSYTIASYAVLVGSLGVASYGQRECSRLRNEKTELSRVFLELFILKAITVVVCLLLYLIPSLISLEYGIYLKALTIYIISGIFDISWFFRGIENFKRVTLWQIFIKLISLILLFLLIKSKDDLLFYTILISASTLFGNLFMWLIMPKYVFFNERKNIKPFRHLKHTFVYFVPTIATSIYTQLDKLMIGWITKDDFENGYYEQATKIITMCKSIVLTINTVMSARMSFLFKENQFDEIKIRLNNTANYIFLISIPMTIGLSLIASDFVPIFFGEGYNPVIILIYIMAPILLVVGLSNVLGACYFTPSGQRARSNKVIISGAILNFLFNLLLIPFFKSVGAAIASILAETFIAFVYSYMGRERLKYKTIGKMIWKKLLAIAIMTISILPIKFFMETSIIKVVLMIIIGALIYCTFLLIIKDDIILLILRKVMNIFKKTRKTYDKG